MPKDRFGREIDYLRISVIDHCNLRCVYCMPLRGLSFIPSPELLTPAEIETVAKAAVSLGFGKFRLTGGEPTLRPDILEIVGRIAAIEGVRDVAMTTNAILLPRLAGPLKAAGLRRLNIHVDSLDPERLRKLMRFGTLSEIEAGIAAA
ncbi:MAG TPA: radical SAM protein, partial [Vicinamibacteria bacterium]|nr:radical SAM protein [Vicinamibacteria bacterium]